MWIQLNMFKHVSDETCLNLCSCGLDRVNICVPKTFGSDRTFVEESYPPQRARRVRMRRQLRGQYCRLPLSPSAHHVHRCYVHTAVHMDGLSSFVSEDADGGSDGRPDGSERTKCTILEVSASQGQQTLPALPAPKRREAVHTSLPSTTHSAVRHW